MTRVLLPESTQFLLSVNDDPTMEQGLFDWLYENGTVIVRARSTAKAMELLGCANYSAVITNLRRFEFGGMNDNAGIELTQQLRRVNAHVPIFIYTINIDGATRQLALSSGATMITADPAKLQAGLKECGF